MIFSGTIRYDAFNIVKVTFTASPLADSGAYDP
jgi:hypothetical protein